jgi:hypothetical protein
MIVANSKPGEWVIIEEPKESRSNPVVNKTPKTPEPPVIELDKEEPKEETPVSFEGMSRDEIMTFIKATDDIEKLKPLLSHDLKTVRDSAEKKIQQLQNNQ